MVALPPSLRRRPARPPDRAQPGSGAGAAPPGSRLVPGATARWGRQFTTRSRPATTALAADLMELSMMAMQRERQEPELAAGSGASGRSPAAPAGARDGLRRCPRAGVRLRHGDRAARRHRAVAASRTVARGPNGRRQASWSSTRRAGAHCPPPRDVRGRVGLAQGRLADTATHSQAALSLAPPEADSTGRLPARWAGWRPGRSVTSPPPAPRTPSRSPD